VQQRDAPPGAPHRFHTCRSAPPRVPQTQKLGFVIVAWALTLVFFYWKQQAAPAAKRAGAPGLARPASRRKKK